MTAGTAEKTLRSEDELRELAAAGARELGAELDADGHVPAEGEADHTAAIRWVAENFPNARVAVALSLIHI